MFLEFLTIGKKKAFMTMSLSKNFLQVFGAWKFLGDT